ncbi:MAG TPA: PH domain-containing protein, partial [Tepidisphaeraceae bacterium]
DDSEEVYFQGSPLLRGEIGRVTFFWVLALLFIVVPFFFKLPWWAYVAGIVIGLLIGIVPLLKTRAIRYRISNYRIDFDRGILSRNVDTLELWHVEDISLHQSLIDRVLGVGTITVISHDDTNPRLELKSLPRPRALFDSLKQRIISVKRQRGVLKMDIPPETHQ